MSFTLSARHIKRLCEINSFVVPNSGLVFFGLRGCLPLMHDEYAFQEEVQLQGEPVDYLHPRCVLGQWKPADDLLAVFPGSTVPHAKHVRAAQVAGGTGANELTTGYYADYRKGVHNASKPTGHAAFRQTKAHPIRRTADDFDYDTDDRVEITNPFDNIHAAWCQGVSQADYASAGCQVVVGYPKCERRGKQPAVGPWKTFQANAYALQQDRFPYLLLTSRDAEQVALQPAVPMPAKLRFGSQGPLVEKLQRALKKAAFYEGKIDGDFGDRTIRALLAFQQSTFGPQGDDGIAGPITASALSLKWPEV